jgi:hypothetical protein
MWQSAVLVVPHDVSERMTFEDLSRLDCGTRLWFEQFSSGGAFLILRGGFSLTAYLGVPLCHPASNASYESLLSDNDWQRNIHGGINFSEPGDGVHLPSDFYWFGWDYAHCTDFKMRDPDFRNLSSDVQNQLLKLERLLNDLTKTKKRAWTVKEVLEDSRSAIEAFNRALKHWLESRDTLAKLGE